jgi:hypothetical protein
VSPAEQILSALAAPKCVQASIANLYAEAILSAEVPDWRTINQAIVDRWSWTGLKRVKERAWKIAYPKGLPE